MRLVKGDIVSLYVVLATLFLIGGVIQYFAILSITKTNLLLSCLIILILIQKTHVSNLVSDAAKLWPILLYCLLLLVVAFYHRNSITTLLAYSLSALFPMLAFLYAKYILFENTRVVYFTIKVLKLILIIQVPVLIFQSIFGEVLVELSRADISLIDDINSGTFFIKSDYTIGLFANLFLSAFLFSEKKKRLTKSVIIYVLSISVIIFLVNSKLSQLMFVMIIALFLLRKGFSIDKHLTSSFGAFGLFFSLIIIANIDISGGYDLIIQERFKMISEIERAAPGEHIPRYAVFLSLFGKLDFLGNGLYDYYNYLTKEWKFFAGHSLWFSLYNDTGPIGCLLIILFYWKLFFSTALNKTLATVQFVLATVLSSTGFLLYDFGALILLAVFAKFNEPWTQSADVDIVDTLFNTEDKKRMF